MEPGLELGGGGRGFGGGGLGVWSEGAWSVQSTSQTYIYICHDSGCNFIFQESCVVAHVENESC